ncbi:MAG: sialate O-acetylesterase [Saccharofermentans sp.]|nr:sialate O-acetylesterase [Saccharofermentans sp.]
MAITLNGIFKDKMVFQWGAEIRIFGSSDRPCAIRAALIKNGDEISSGTCNTEQDGSFLVCMEPVNEPGGPYEIKIFEDAVENRVIKDAYAGEVWLAAGGGNMEYPLVRSEFAKFLIPKIGNTEIRYYKVPSFGHMNKAQAKAEAESEWVDVNSETAGQMSAVAFYFARELESRIDTKIGIIQCCSTRSTIDNWQSVESLLTTKEGRQYISDFDDAASELTPDEYDEADAEYREKYRRYNEELQAILKEDPYITYPEADLKIGPAPWPAPIGHKSARHPGSVFECMILRVAPYTLRGVVFYQGEADTDGHQSEYGHVFKTMIKEWRDVFFDDHLPFIFCQLPMYISRDRKYMGYDDMSWPILREQQQIVAIDMPNVYMAVIVDCGEFNNLFPSNKKTPGDRMALLAEKFVYGFAKVDAVSPFIIDARRGEGVEISFGGDYLLLNLTTGFGPDDSGFEVAGEDGKFFPAEADVDFDGKTVLLSCPMVEFPSKVRYAFFSYGPTPLHAQNGLTVTPFQVRIDKDLGGI